MGESTKIEWTDASWTPIRAYRQTELRTDPNNGRVGWHCEHVSEGCRFCYAESMNRRLGTGLDFKPGHRRDVHIVLDEKLLTAPLHWKRPRKIFVCSMTDLFADFVTDEMIGRIFAVMALCPQHTFQCLTKRAERMRAYCSAPDVTHRVAKAIDAVLVDVDHDKEERWLPIPEFPQYDASTHGRVRRDGNILQEQINQHFDRASVTLWRDNEPTTRWVHVLVLTAHRGMPADGEETCHRNGNKRDNRLANLRWGTRGENQQDKVRHGSSGGPAKLTREQVAEIRFACAQQRETQQDIAGRYGVARSLISMIKDRKVWPDALTWPLPNVWLGVSTEDQETADARIPHLLAAPAAVRFLSYEPALARINLRHEWLGWKCAIGGRVGTADACGDCDPCIGAIGKRFIDLVICGGESGPKARPLHLSWLRSVIAQCRAAGVACFVKQLGRAAVDDISYVGASPDLKFRSPKGGDMEEWPEEFRVRQFPNYHSRSLVTA